VAFAGSGKTTTLLRFTENNPKTRFLLIVYNRAVSDEAGGKFPNNVKCRTIHQLAYRHIIATGLMKNKKLGNIFPTSLVESHILQKDRRGLKRYQREKLVLDTLNRFWGSADDTITPDHAPTKISSKSSSEDNTPGENVVEDRILTLDDRQVRFS
jgi:F-box protein 18 (helicase)